MKFNVLKMKYLINFWNNLTLYKKQDSWLGLKMPHLKLRKAKLLGYKRPHPMPRKA